MHIFFYDEASSCPMHEHKKKLSFKFIAKDSWITKALYHNFCAALISICTCDNSWITTNEFWLPSSKRMKINIKKSTIFLLWNLRKALAKIMVESHLAGRSDSKFYNFLFCLVFLRFFRTFLLFSIHSKV